VSLLNIDAGLERGNKMWPNHNIGVKHIWSHFVMMLESDLDVQQTVAGVLIKS